MTEPSARQVLYGLVGLGIHLVVAVLVVGATKLVPGWWTALAAVLWTGIGVVAGSRWRRTSTVLGLTIGFFLAWVLVTLAVR